MKDDFPSRTGLGDGDTGAFKGSGEESIKESVTLPPPVDSSTPLLASSSEESNTDPEAQQTSTILSDEYSAPMTWIETGYVVVTVIAFIASAAVPAAFETSGLDPLYFTKLTWHSIAVSMVVSSILVRWLPSGWKPRLFRCISH
jgi:hypothetical protein